MKLFRAEVTVVVYLLAEDYLAAAAEAPEAIEKEIRENEITALNNIRPVASLAGVDVKWLNAIPHGDNPDGVTCRQFVEASDAARRAAAPAPGQLGLPGLAPADPIGDALRRKGRSGGQDAHSASSTGAP